jgi:hypothetical protein
MLVDKNLKYCHMLVTVDGYWIVNWIYYSQSYTQVQYNRVSPDSLSLTTHDWLYHSNSAAIVTAATLVTGELLVPFLFRGYQLTNSTLQQLRRLWRPNPGYQLNSEVYDLWSDCREDNAFGIGCLAITKETGTLRPRACTLPSNVYSMACTSQYV